MCTRGLVGRHPRPANSAQAATSRGRRSARGPATGTLPRPGNGPKRSAQQETAMSAQPPDLSITADTVPGRRGALTASPSQAAPANTPAGGRLPLSATERTRHRRYRHLGRTDPQALYAVLDAGPDAAAVRLLAVPLDEASVKLRTGRPADGDSPDAALGLWAGELPLATTWQQPIPDPALPPGIPVPAHISCRAGTRADRSTSSTPGSRTDKRSEG